MFSIILFLNSNQEPMTKLSTIDAFKQFTICVNAVFVEVCTTFECKVVAPTPFGFKCSWDSPVFEPNEAGIETVKDLARYIEKKKNMKEGTLKEIEIKETTKIFEGSTYRINAGVYQLTSDQSNFVDLEVIKLN